MNEKPNIIDPGPQKTWFIKRLGDGHVFASEEKDVACMLKERSNWKRKDFEIIGVSDGKTYRRVLREQGLLKQDLQEEITELTSILKRYRVTEEKLKFDDLLDDTDEKLIKVRKIINETNDKLDVKEEELMNIEKTIKKKAFDAELAVAEGNIEMPRSFSVVTPGADAVTRNKIMQNLGL